MSNKKTTFEIIEDTVSILAHIAALIVFTVIYPVICFIGYLMAFIIQTLKDTYNHVQD